MGPSNGEKIETGIVSGFTNTDNPVVKDSSTDKRIVVLVDDEFTITQGEQIAFTIHRELNDHYQASRPSSESPTNTEESEHTEPISKPEYSGTPNIPLHHDGKYGQSLGETRRERHSIDSVESREFNPETYGAPRLSREKNHPE